MPAHFSPAQRRRLLAGASAWFVLWLALAIAPSDRGDWLLENLLVFCAVALLAAIWRRVRLSEPSYWMIAAFLALHTIGAHYTYAETPVGFWIQELLGQSRNHYDRVIHFGFGLLIARPMLEFVVAQANTRGPWAYTLAFALITASSAIYELIEWIIASLVSPDTALAWLGTQGDIFDAQKDTGLAVAGAVLALATDALIRRPRI